MLSFETTTSIAAPADHVWDTLVDTSRWPHRGAGIDRVAGRLGPGEHLTIHVVDASRPFRLRVVAWEPARRIELRGGMPLGLFTGRRTYRLRPDGRGTRFEMVERFGGPLAPLIGRTIPDPQPSFDAFAAGLRAAAEVEAAAGQAD